MQCIKDSPNKCHENNKDNNVRVRTKRKIPLKKSNYPYNQTKKNKSDNNSDKNIDKVFKKFAEKIIHSYLL